MIEKIFNDCHGALLMDSLLTLDDIYFMPSAVEKLGLPESPDSFLDYLGVELNDIYYNNESLFNKYFYLKGFVMVEIPSFDVNALKSLRIKERIELQSSRIEEYQVQGKWDHVFSLADKRLLIPKFIEIYRHLPKDQIVDIFSDLWVRSESGFEMITEDILCYVYTYQGFSQEYQERMSRLQEVAKGERFITVYHGSTEVGDDFSWSLSRKVAQWFANRFGNNGSVEKGRVAVEDIVDYLDSRGESEVLILPKDVLVI